MKYQLIIFDWDGTLANSTERIVDSMLNAAAECGLERLQQRSVQQIIGLGLPEALQQLWPGITGSQRQQMTTAYARYFVHDSHVPMGFYPGALEMLVRLKSQAKLAVATGKSRKGLDRLLSDNNLVSMFDVTRCADETRSKPDPQMLREILQIMQCDVGQAVMIGDTTYDLDMARVIGMDAVGVSFGAHSVENLQKSSPVTIVHSIEQLATWLMAVD